MNSRVAKFRNNHSAPLANGRGSAQRGGSELQKMADQRPEAALQRQVQAWGDGSERVGQLRAWQGVADGRGAGGKRQDLTPGFRTPGFRAHPAAQLQRFSGTGEASKTILRKMNLDVVQCLRKLKNEDEAIMHFEDNLMDNLDETLDEVMELRALGTEKNWDTLLEIIDEALEEAQSTGSSKRLLLKTIAEMDFSNLKNLATMIKVLELAQDNGYDDIEDILIKPVRKLEDAHEKVKPIYAAAKEKPDSEKHESTLEKAKNLSLDDVFLFFAEQQGVQLQAAQDHLGTVRDAHSLNPKTFSASQEKYQKLLTNTLGLSAAKIMNYHKSAGYEYEFASFVDLTKEEVAEVELLPSHVDLARSGVMSSIFELPYKLETDSGNSLEIATPPYIFLSSKESKSILSNLFDMLSNMSVELMERISEPDQSPLKSKTAALNESGFGQNWAFTSAADNLSATGNRKHKSGPYGQVNVSMTSKEIGKFMGNLVNEDNSTQQMFLTRDKTFSTELFRQISELLLSSYKPVGVSTPSMKEALFIYARYAANLIAIPSILMRQQYKDYEQKPDPNYATEVKESLGLWVKDNPHNVLLQYMYSLKDEAATFKSIVARSEGKVAEKVSCMVISSAGDVERWITHMKSKQMEERIKQKFSVVSTMPHGQEKLNAAKDFQNWKKNEAVTVKDDISLAFKTWEVNYQEQMMAELIAMNKLILGTAPPPSAKGAFLNEQFGSGLGVRKDTYLPSISATDRTLRVGEIRGKKELGIYENME